MTPALESDCREQTALYWAVNGFDNYGNPKVDSRVELSVRWEEVDTETLDALGNTVRVDASVVVDRDIAPGSVMWLGAIADIAGTAESPGVDLRTVVSFKKTPDIKGREFRRVVLLGRLSDTLPTLA